MPYSIGEMAQQLGVATSTLRYYDKIGLLPSLQRSDGGVRTFSESDAQLLRLIECLKKTGMPLKDIKAFVAMAAKGDETIDDRLKLFEKQRRNLLAQIDELNGMLNILDYKCWYYQTAHNSGTTATPEDIPDEELPENLRKARMRLKICKKTAP